MIRLILMIAGVILSIWLIFAVLGTLISMFKMLLTVAVIAVIGYLAVRLVLGLSRK